VNARFLTLLGSALFVFYCTAVGVYLLLHPWFPGPRAGAGLPASGYFRGFVSGLGLVHLLAGIADVRALARSFDAAAGRTGPSVPEEAEEAAEPGEAAEPAEPEPESRASASASASKLP
jgi:hypothetical protein